MSLSEFIIITNIIITIILIIIIIINLRELFYDRNPGDARVKVGSDREAASSPDAANGCVDEIGTLAIQILSAGTLQNWP